MQVFSSLSYINLLNQPKNLGGRRKTFSSPVMPTIMGYPGRYYAFNLNVSVTEFQKPEQLGCISGVRFHVFQNYIK